MEDVNQILFLWGVYTAALYAKGEFCCEMRVGFGDGPIREENSEVHEMKDAVLAEEKRELIV